MDNNSSSNALEEERHRMNIAYEAHKRETELRSRELQINYELQIRKADTEHQHKIAELITLMKLTKLQTGKELLLSYMETMNLIIQQNGASLNAIMPLLQKLESDKLSTSLEKATEKAIKKIFDTYKTTEELLDYSKKTN
ncbi:6128_t:CDS:2 [Funneliformis mosseae]|uniref:6128_t:CDS:1 n=1 Tax=Funneliformis mosseae TaxID=27381 RepID=A0A9N9FIV7_FUNMO|nr:6128_t:CDS:2 [Funneliformis mosseae]